MGENHPNHGGIIPCGQMSFFENDRPMYVLSPFGDADENKLTRWVPSIEHTLEDGLLMIAVYVMGAFEIKEIAANTYHDGSGSPFEVYEHLDEATHQKLLEETRRLAGFPKLVITVLEGSHLISQLSAIKRYSMDVELCFAGYSREKSEWTQGTRITDFIDFLSVKPA